MSKRHILTASEAFDLRQALHVATLDALVSSRRWEPGDLVFQGGTSLHLAHGSPRFSEDLDFLVDSSLNLDAISDAIHERLAETAWLPPGTVLSVGKAKDGRNPHSFVVAIKGQDVIGSVRVKVELWQAAGEAVLAVGTVVAPVRLVRGPAAGMQAFVPTACLPEIYADKVFALAARSYLKPRDVFDIHWLTANNGIRECPPDAMRIRLATYPSETPEAWLDKAFVRMDELRSSTASIANDLKRWLPSSWPLNESGAGAMAGAAAVALGQGIGLMRKIACEQDSDPAPDQNDDDHTSPAP